MAMIAKNHVVRDCCHSLSADHGGLDVTEIAVRFVSRFMTTGWDEVVGHMSVRSGS